MTIEAESKSDMAHALQTETLADRPSLSVLDSKSLIFVTGKGGVGKTTVVSNLIYRFLKSGQKTLHLTIEESGEALSSRWSPGDSLSGYYSFINLSGKDCFKEYIGSRSALNFLADRVLRGSLYKVFINAAPGLKELMVLGKIINEVNSGEWQKVIVDLPSSGHALAFLNVPLITKTTFASGLVGKESARIASCIQDSSSTAIVPVAVPEDMSVTEVLELCHSSRTDLGVALPLIVLNKYPGELISQEALDKFLLREEFRGEEFQGVKDLLSLALEVHLSRAAKAAIELKRLKDLSGCPVFVSAFSVKREYGLTILPELMQ